ncbi:hypothetical protein NDU88_012087 [Pleurodeles waltl]|uniref:Uncharacterized protein n=1 Tax=Pleurodeles waltl TaxID=8319 RepID=A0AAV7S3P1_PLEWA|nr:hypothetical protein NDU88_012087 [Pleurodeles waltl]
MGVPLGLPSDLWKNAKDSKAAPADRAVPRRIRPPLRPVPLTRVPLTLRRRPCQAQHLGPRAGAQGGIRPAPLCAVLWRAQQLRDCIQERGFLYI